MFIYLNLKRRGHRAGMPEWSKGPDSSKNLLLDKNSRFLVDNVCVGSNPTFSIFFFSLHYQIMCSRKLRETGKSWNEWWREVINNGFSIPRNCKE